MLPSQRSSPDILIVGQDGTLGRDLARACAQAGLSWAGTSRGQIDLSQPSENWILPGHCGVAILCAAETRLSVCEKNPKETHFINVQQTLLLAEQLIARGAALIFPTTTLDGVTSTYGRQKSETSAGLLKRSDKIATVRIAKVVHSHFPLFREWHRALSRNESISPFNDHFFSPILLSRITEELLELAQNFQAGCWNLSGDRFLSYAEAASLLAARKNFPSHLIQPLPRPPSLATADPKNPPIYRGPLYGNAAPSVEDTLHTIFQEMA